MTLEEKHSLARIAYACIQGTNEEIDQRPAARMGTLDDANSYTQRVFHDMVEAVVAAYEALHQRER